MTKYNFSHLWKIQYLAVRFLRKCSFLENIFLLQYYHILLNVHFLKISFSVNFIVSCFHFHLKLISSQLIFRKSVGNVFENICFIWSVNRILVLYFTLFLSFCFKIFKCIWFYRPQIFSFFRMNKIMLHLRNNLSQAA